MNMYTEIQKLAGHLKSDNPDMVKLIASDIRNNGNYEDDLILFEGRCSLPVRWAIEVY
jgi:hypothetical protein